MKIELYEGIVEDLTGLTYVKGDLSTGRVETVALWANQIQREGEQMPRLLPAVYIEFLPSEFMESSSKIHQTVNMIVRLHIVFESKKTTDLDILYLTQAVFGAMQGAQYGMWGVMKRRNEEQDFDHDNLQDYIQDYSVGMGKDYGADRRPTTVATVDTINILPEIDQDLE